MKEIEWLRRMMTVSRVEKLPSLEMKENSKNIQLNSMNSMLGNVVLMETLIVLDLVRTFGVSFYSYYSLVQCLAAQSTVSITVTLRKCWHLTIRISISVVLALRPRITPSFISLSFQRIRGKLLLDHSSIMRFASRNAQRKLMIQSNAQLVTVPHQSQILWKS